ncbi:hypothetical protein [Azospira restricta]|uniref:Uncharacterized protein n=1 Tax=Azospira restricta TaxID=404405 RepID=A0A974SQ78_9RHOO|nr:hypothetical protein [Azospira restricta]QRJ64435.1 hypothetical protein IWH25_03530 [Azospira restricta]
MRLLSLANQLDSTTRRVTLNFQEGLPGTMGYLNRLGFFDHLARGIDVLPARPQESGASIFRGQNSDLVEIARINPSCCDRTLPGRLADVIEHSVGDLQDSKTIGHVAFTVFGELIDNIFQHSSTLLDGFAALQVYGGRRRKAIVVVSDSGLGLMETLRPALCTEYPALQHLSDAHLLLRAFREGLSRHGQGRGCGLKTSAEQAIKYNASVEVRLPQSRIQLAANHGQYELNTTFCVEGLPLVWGTHYCFSFGLDTHR